jgi:uncharacterized membrane protein YozB (DUF420 family)
MFDLIVVGMLFVLFALGWSLYSVRYRKKYNRHKSIQIILSGALVAILALFEIDVQFFDNWRERAAASPYYDEATGTGLAADALWVHLGFAVSTLVVWVAVMVRAVRGFPGLPQQGAHSRSHARWGKVAALGMVMTTVTGWIFYVLAFVL